MNWVGRVICCGVVLVMVGWPLYELVKQLKASDRPAASYIIDAAKIQPGAPPRQTGDPYWDHILGYGGPT